MRRLNDIGQDHEFRDGELVLMEPSDTGREVVVEFKARRDAPYDSKCLGCVYFTESRELVGPCPRWSDGELMCAGGVSRGFWAWPADPLRVDLERVVMADEERAARPF